MNLIQVFTRYPDHEACIEHLEAVRWGDKPSCPHCGSVHVARKADGHRIGRWNCHDCTSSFNVLSGTIFQKTKIDLQKWFLAIAIIMNAKKSLSSYQLGRDLEMNQKSAWRMMQCIRAQMMSKQQNIQLQGIIEADETYVGGKPRKGNKREDDKPNKRGRGTSKTPVIGAVERGGEVVARVVNNVTGKGVLDFLKTTVCPSGSMLVTDEFRGYNSVADLMPHAVINHQVAYVDGYIHTNTIEGFWSLVKRAWYGSHHHYSRKWMPLYIAEGCYKYNNRKNPNAFSNFVRGCFG